MQNLIVGKAVRASALLCETAAAGQRFFLPTLSKKGEMNMASTAATLAPSPAVAPPASPIGTLRGLSRMSRTKRRARSPM